jgi:hypothetical protein
MKGQETRAAPQCPVPGTLWRAGIKPGMNVETRVEEPWELKDLRKTCAS